MEFLLDEIVTMVEYPFTQQLEANIYTYIQESRNGPGKGKKMVRIEFVWPKKIKIQMLVVFVKYLIKYFTLCIFKHFFQLITLGNMLNGLQGEGLTTEEDKF